MSSDLLSEATGIGDLTPGGFPSDLHTMPFSECCSSSSGSSFAGWYNAENDQKDELKRREKRKKEKFNIDKRSSRQRGVPGNEMQARDLLAHSPATVTSVASI